MSLLSRIQGQFRGKTREYFYYIDHQGMLFLEDVRVKNFTSCFKDVKFLQFFYKNLRSNADEYAELFPWISLCGRERNYIRCDDLPIVFSHTDLDHDIIASSSSSHDDISSSVDNPPLPRKLCYGYYTGLNLAVDFHPSKLSVGDNGHVYHPTFHRDSTLNLGLVSSRLSIKWKFDYGDDTSSGSGDAKAKGVWFGQKFYSFSGNVEQ